MNAMFFAVFALPATALTPNNAALSITAASPTVSVSYSITPNPATITLAASAGSVAANYAVNPTAANIGLSAGAGAIGAGYAIFPNASTIGLTAIAGAVVPAYTVAPALAAISLTAAAGSTVPAYTLTPANASLALTAGIGIVSVSYAIAPTTVFVTLASGAGAIAYTPPIASTANTAARTLSLPGRVDWYRDRADGLWTTEMDPRAVLTMRVDWTGLYSGVVSVTALAPISEVGSATGVVNAFDDTGMTFTVTGSGSLLPFRIAFAGGQFDDRTLRIRSVTT